MSAITNDEGYLDSRFKNRKLTAQSSINLSANNSTSDIFTINITDAIYTLSVDFNNVLINSEQVKFSCSKDKLKIHSEDNDLIILKSKKVFKVLLKDPKIEFEDNQSRFQINVKNDYLVVSTSAPFGISVNKNIISFTNNVIDASRASIILNSTMPGAIELQDNKKLLISEQQNKTFLPYTAKDINEKLKNPKYNSVDEVIEQEYTVSNNYYRFPMIARFKEAYKLIREKEHGSIAKAVDLGLELMINFSLNPSIITACRNLEELNIYLDCLEENELDKFLCFDIVYEISPTKI